MTAGALAARLAGHHRCRRSLFDWIHPERLPSVPCADRLQRCDAARAAALADAWLDALGMPVPQLDAFGAPGAALALLPVRECLAVFRLRALVAHAEPLRSWIDRPRRGLLTEWIGARGIRLLFDRGREWAGGARRLAGKRGDDMPGGQALLGGARDGDALAWLGLHLFEGECGWAHDGPLAIMRLAMPAGIDAALPLPSTIPSGGGFNASLAIVAELPNLFPERSW